MKNIFRRQYFSFAVLTVFFLCFTMPGYSQIKTDNLLLHLPLDGTAADSSGNNHHGTYYNITNAIDSIAIIFLFVLIIFGI